VEVHGDNRESKKSGAKAEWEASVVSRWTGNSGCHCSSWIHEINLSMGCRQKENSQFPNFATKKKLALRTFKNLQRGASY
jgi:hypothetical protein